MILACPYCHSANMGPEPVHTIALTMVCTRCDGVYTVTVTLVKKGKNGKGKKVA